MLLVTLNSMPTLPSRGHLYWDDGDSADSIENKVNNIIHFNATQVRLKILRQCIDVFEFGYLFKGKH